MNYKRLLFTGLIAATGFSLQAQKHEMDSIYKVLSTEKEDTNKVKTLISISVSNWVKLRYDSSIKYANNATTLADKIGYAKGKGNALMMLGNNYKDEAKFNDALNYYTQSLDVFMKMGDKLGTARDYGNLGITYESTGNYSKAVECYFNALGIFKDLKNEDGEAKCHQNMGNAYIFLGEFSKSMENYNSALSIFQKTGDSGGISDSYQNLAHIYYQQHDTAKSLDYYSRSLAISLHIGDSESAAHVLGNLANIYTDLRKFDKAMEYAITALNITKKIGELPEYGFDLETVGYIYQGQKKYDKAMIYFDSALSVARTTGDKERAEDIFKGVSILDSAKGDFKSAWKDYKNYIRYRDSLINQATIKKTTQVEMNYDFNRKTDSTKAVQDKLNAVNEKESQRQKVIRNAFIGGFGLAFLASGLFFFQRRKIAKEKKRSDELLLNILPEETAEELKATGSAKAKSFETVSVMFTDFKDFTKIAEKLSPEDLVAELHTIFQAFDTIIQKHNIEKIKTIGDSYMAAGGLPAPNNTHAGDVVSAALEIQQFMLRHNNQRALENKPVFEARVGINSGPVVAGIVGIKKFAYDIWGDTVNLASRVESNGEPGKVNIRGSTYELVKNNFKCIYRGKIHAKNKGEVDMYFVEEDLQEKITV